MKRAHRAVILIMSLICTLLIFFGPLSLLTPVGHTQHHRLHAAEEPPPRAAEHDPEPPQPATPKEAHSAYAQLVLSHQPVGYWRLSESADAPTIQDLSPHRRHGRVVGTVAFNNRGAIKGENNGSVTLTGNGYLEVPDDRAFSIPTSGKGLTVEVWMRPDVLRYSDEYIHWLGKGEPARYEWGLRFYSDDQQRPNRISGYAWNPSGGQGAGSYFQDTLTLAKWMHIVVCFEHQAVGDDEAGVLIYRDGVFRKGPPEPPTLYLHPPHWMVTPAHGTAPLRFGVRNGKALFAGGLDEIAIYPRVLTKEEIQQHFQIATEERN